MSVADPDLQIGEGGGLKKNFFGQQRRRLSDWLISSVISLVNLLKVILRAGKNAKVRGSFGGVG